MEFKSTGDPYHDIARKLWLLMYSAFRGGAACQDERQMTLYKEAKDLAHGNLELGNQIVLMHPTPPQRGEK